MLQVLQVTSPASGKGKESGVQDGDVDVHDVVTSGVWRDDPGCLCVFSWHCELQKGQCSDLTRPFFADSHWEAEPYQRLFLQLKKLQRGIELPPRDRGFRPCHRTTLCSLTAKWFGELRMGPTLRDTLDTGLCCSSQGRGHRTII